LLAANEAANIADANDVNDASDGNDANNAPMTGDATGMK